MTPEEREEYLRKGRERAKKRNHIKNQQHRERYATDPAFRDRVREIALTRAYGLTLADVAAMSASQRGRCAICGDRFTETPHVDHFHDPSLGCRRKRKWIWNPGVTREQKRATVRWVSCDACNSGIGLLGEDPRVLRSAAAKLDAWARQRRGLSLREARAGQSSIFDVLGGTTT